MRKATWVLLCIGVLVGAAALMMRLGFGWLAESTHPVRTVVEPLSWLAALLSLLVGAAQLWQGRARTATATAQVTPELVKDLLQRVRQREQVALTAMLGSVAGAQPAQLRIQQPDLVYWRTDGGKKAESSNRIAAFYRGLGRGRLVLLGQPGAGKSVLAMCLCGDLASLALKDPETAVLPVRMDVLAFNMTGYPHKLSGEQASAALFRWMRQMVARHLDVELDAAAELFRQGRVLPVLDGLDEMDGETGEPIRARELLRALNFPVRGDLVPVVLTSRTAQYESLTKHLSAEAEQRINALFNAIGEEPFVAPEPASLQNATVVRLEPLEPKHIADYLGHCFPNPANSREVEPRWSAVAAAVLKRGDTPLKQLLALPLNLFLVTSSYAKPSSDPDELTRIGTREELQDFLFRKLIDVNVDRAHDQHYYQRTWTAESVTGWLVSLAEQSTWVNPPPYRFQVRVHELWRLAGPDLARYITGAVAAAAATAVTIGKIASDGWSLSLSTIVLLQVTAVALLTTRSDRVPLQFTIRHILTIPRRRLIAPAVLAGLAVYFFAQGSYIYRNFGAITLLTSFFVLLVAGLHSYVDNREGWLRGDIDTLELNWFQPPAMRNPVAFVRSGAANNVIFVGAFAVFIGYFAASGRSAGFTLVFSAFLVVASATPWPRYFVAAPLLSLTKVFPGRPARFLHWAQHAGLLVANGDAL